MPSASRAMTSTKGTTQATIWGEAQPKGGGRGREGIGKGRREGEGRGRGRREGEGRGRGRREGEGIGR